MGLDFGCPSTTHLYSPVDIYVQYVCIQVCTRTVMLPLTGHKRITILERRGKQALCNKLFFKSDLLCFQRVGLELLVFSVSHFTERFAESRVSLLFSLLVRSLLPVCMSYRVVARHIVMLCAPLPTASYSDLPCWSNFT